MLQGFFNCLELVIVQEEQAGILLVKVTAQQLSKVFVAGEDLKLTYLTLVLLSQLFWYIVTIDHVNFDNLHDCISRVFLCCISIIDKIICESMKDINLSFCRESLSLISRK